MKMDIRAILFDKDGTLADFSATFNPAAGKVIERISDGDQALMTKIANAWGYDLESGEIRDDSIIVAGSGLDITIRLADVMEIGDPRDYSVYLDRLYGEICRETVVEIPGTSAALKKLQAEKYILGVATNDSEANAESQMKSLEIDHLFERILGADSGFGAKPEPGMIEAFIDHTHLDASQILMVGDSTHDLEAGRAAGVMTCGVETGPAAREILEPLSDVVLASVADLPKWLSESM